MLNYLSTTPFKKHHCVITLIYSHFDCFLKSQFSTAPLISPAKDLIYSYQTFPKLSTIYLILTHFVCIFTIRSYALFNGFNFTFQKFPCSNLLSTKISLIKSIRHSVTFLNVFQVFASVGVRSHTQLSIYLRF